MDTFDVLVKTVIVLAMASGPVILARRLPRAPALLTALGLACVLAIAWALWPHYYGQLRLEQLGFDSLGMSEADRLASVAPADRSEARRIYGSLMGVGWPLRAMLVGALAGAYAVFVVVAAGRSRVAAA